MPPGKALSAKEKNAVLLSNVSNRAPPGTRNLDNPSNLAKDEEETPAIVAACEEATTFGVSGVSLRISEIASTARYQTHLGPEKTRICVEHARSLIRAIKASTLSAT